MRPRDKAKKPKKRAAGHCEMLLPIAGKGIAKEKAKSQPSRRQGSVRPGRRFQQVFTRSANAQRGPSPPVAGGSLMGVVLVFWANGGGILKKLLGG
jgi:hypothetical protein